MDNSNYTIALLIDTDNVSAKYMSALNKELIILGKITHKRMYGDFTNSQAEGWRNIVNDFSITPVQQYTYTTGKNATDSRMIIDAMDILYSKNVDAVCIMSSDSDFTGLAKRLKESNIYVIGAGEKKTPSSFINSCDRFFRLEELLDKDAETVEKPKAAPKKKSSGKQKTEEKYVEEIPVVEETPEILSKIEVENFAVKVLEEMNGKPCSLSNMVNKIYQAYPQFNFKNYNAKKSYDFFSKDKFVITTSNKTEKFIRLKV